LQAVNLFILAEHGIGGSLENGIPRHPAHTTVLGGGSCTGSESWHSDRNR